ncbi:hypothetical protein [Streptomyces sp. NPDC053367]|uniref:hypothetical protein n=1 Tax=Streptomyces sp. NPDC053367 TaxID=3365700 RepID=UPI0037D49023
MPTAHHQPDDPQPPMGWPEGASSGNPAPEGRDPCPPADRQVCRASRKLARALLGRIAVNAHTLQPQIRTIVATHGDPGYTLWRLHGANGRLLIQFGPYSRPGPAWGALIADLNVLAGLADLRTHPPGYFYVHHMSDPRDIAVPLPVRPRGRAPRTIERLQTA